MMLSMGFGGGAGARASGTRRFPIVGTENMTAGESKATITVALLSSGFFSLGVSSVQRPLEPR